MFRFTSHLCLCCSSLSILPLSFYLHLEFTLWISIQCVSILPFYVFLLFLLHLPFFRPSFPSSLFLSLSFFFFHSLFIFLSFYPFFIFFSLFASLSSYQILILLLPFIHFPSSFTPFFLFLSFTHSVCLIHLLYALPPSSFLPPSLSSLSLSHLTRFSLPLIFLLLLSFLPPLLTVSVLYLTFHAAPSISPPSSLIP